MRVPAALEQWAAEHDHQLSEETLSEVRSIADAVAESSFGDLAIADVDESIETEFMQLFSQSRAERAVTLVRVVRDWAAKRAVSPESVVSAPLQVPQEPTTDLALHQALGEPIEAPALFGSDTVDEEDDVRLYGPKRPWKAVAGSIVAIALLAGAGAFGWWWVTQRTDVVDSVTVDAPAATPSVEADQPPTAEPEAPQPTPVPEPTVPAEAALSYWADTVPILNSGTAEISASTYVVSPSNRAVLTGHTAAITGVIVANDGRVFTSGADRRLVDWGADVSLASPDVLNVTSPLTVLERTVDEHILAGDSVGSVSVLDLVNDEDPLVLPIHRVAVSAIAELSNGRIAAASADGDVIVFDLADTSDRTTLSHSVEVTAVVGLEDGTIVTAAVDGIVRLWPATGDGEPGEIATLDAPVTALTLLSSGQLAAASVQGDIHIFDAVDGASADVVLPGHIGAVRALHESPLPGGETLLASGGDDSTIRLWDLTSQTQSQILEGHGDIISGIDTLPDGRLVTTSGDGTGRVWDLRVLSGTPVLAPHDWNLSAMHSWSNDQFVTGGVDGKVVLASTAVTSEPLTLTEHDAPIVGVEVLDNEQTFFSLDANSVLRITNANASESEGEIQVAAGATALDVREGEGIVTGHADGTVRFHDLTEEGLVVAAHRSGVNDVAALTSGLVVSAGQDMMVRIVDPESPDTVTVFDLHTGPVDVVVELADGRVASAGSDGIFVFSPDDLSQEPVRLNGQRARTISLVPLPGDRLISTGEDGRIRLWDLTNPDEEPATLVDIPGVVNPYLIQADNGLFVAGAARGYVVFTLP